MTTYEGSKKGAKAGAPDGLFEKLKGWYALDIVKANAWRKEAREDFKFRDGDQWTEAEKETLQEQKRPVVSFNRTGVLVDAVVGSEIGNRREVRYIPRELADAKPNELLTSSAEWFRDQCDAEDEESDAFKDTVTAGMGWTETRLDYEENPSGEPKVDQVDPFEMVWDANATKANLVDAGRLWRVRSKIDVADAMALLPGIDPDVMNAAWADPSEDDNGEAHKNDPATRYSKEVEGKPRHGGQITLVACQYMEKVPYYQAIILAPPAAEPQQVELDAEKFEIAQKHGIVLKSVKLSRKDVVQCWLGANSIIKAPQPTQTGTFTWSCITGLKDRERGIFYGIVRRAKDPQRWANKWLSQMMHILNSQAKGGIMAEDGAFEDQRKAEQDWAKPEGITILAEGSLGAHPKIMPKPVAQFPAGFDRLLQYADDMIIKATGINMELLGMREVNQPGVLEYQRKQSGMGILATFFASLRRYRKIQGRAMLHLIQNFLADGRKVRIVGDEQAQYVPLMSSEIADVEYDIVVDDAPSSTNEKEKTWQILMQVLPMFKDALGPKEGLLLAEYSPLPTSLVEKLKQSAQESQQAAQEAPMDPIQQASLQIEMTKLGNEQKKMQLEFIKEQNKAREIELKASLEARKLDIEEKRVRSDALSAYSEMNRLSAA